MKYKIYTDESGHWNSKTKNAHYVRCWIKIPLDIRISDNVFEDSNAKIYFTFTKIEEFHKKPFRIRKNIEEKIDATILELGDAMRSYIKKIPSAVISAINKILFINLYERFSWEDAKNVGLMKNVIEYHIHKPQFNESEYYELLSEVGINKSDIKFVSGDSNAGINLSDKYAGYLKKVLDSDFTNPVIIERLRSVLSHNALAGARLSQGIDKVFWDPRNVESDKLIMETVRKNLML